MRLLLLGVALLLQLPPVPVAPGPRASIEGVIVGPGDRPISGAEVRAFWSPPPTTFGSNQVPLAVSCSDGTFRLDELGAGGYRLQVSVPGYVWQEYGAAKTGLQGSGTGTVLTLSPGESVKGLTIHLTTDNILSGRITSTEAAPLVGMEVYALRKIFDSYGHAAWTPEGRRVETNDLGEYRLSGLPSGRYYIRASSPLSGLVRVQQLRAEVEGVAAPATPSPGEYAARFFPGVGRADQATVVEVTSGNEVRNIDIALPRQPLYKIRGRVVDPSTADPPQRVMMGTMPADVEFVSGVGTSVQPYRPDGTFELTDVAPGTYWVRAQLPTVLPPELRQLMSTPGFDMSQLPIPPIGLTLVRVVDADLDNVEVTLVRDLMVRGTVTVEGRALSPDELAGIKVEFRMLDLGRLSPARGAMTMGSDGTFLIKNLPPAKFAVGLSGLPMDLYVREARLDGLDVLTQLVDLTRTSSASLDIVLEKGVDVSGTLTDAASLPASSKEVVLIPVVANRPDLYKTTTSAEDGRFSFHGVAPGEYSAFAWDSIEPYRYFDPEFMRQYQNEGVKVRVTPSSSQTFSLRLLH